MNKVYACFPGGKTKCLTMSYDDGVTQDRRLVSLFNRHGIKGTFHLNSTLLGTGERYLTPEDVANVYQGHEVACHTATHPPLSRCPLPEAAQEILTDRKQLEALVRYPVRGMSYPYGMHTADIRALLPSLGIAYSRIVGDSFGFDLPADFMQWKATCHHSQRLMEMAEKFIAPDHGVHLRLLYVWGHSYEFDNDQNWDLIEQFCDTTGGHEDIWYATNIEVYDAVKAFAELQFSADNSFVRNPCAASAWIRVNNRDIVEIPGGETVWLG